MVKVQKKKKNRWESCLILQSKCTWLCSQPLPSRHLTLPSKGSVNSEQTTSSDLIFFLSLFSESAPFHSTPKKDHRYFLQGSGKVTLVGNLGDDAS